MLDVGIGTGGSLSLYAQASITSAWPQTNRCSGERRCEPAKSRFRWEPTLASAEELPFESESFDAVTTALAFCTVPDAEAAVRQTWRMLQPGGQFRRASPPVGSM